MICCCATATIASARVLRVASGKPLRLNQRRALVRSASASSRFRKLDRGDFEPGIGLSSNVSE